MKIIFSPHNWRYLDGLLEISQTLEKKGAACKIILLAQPPDEVLFKYPKIYQPLQGRASKLADLLAEKIPLFGLTFKAIISIWLLKKFLSKEKADCLILTDDRNFHQLLLIKAARLAKTPKKILWPCEDNITFARLLKHKTKMMLPLNFKRKISLLLCRLFYPANIKHFQNKKVPMATPRLSLQLVGLKILPKNPWTAGSNHLDLIAVSNRAQQQEKIKQGIAPNKIKITGFPKHDQLCLLLKKKTALKKQFQERWPAKGEKIFLIIGTHFEEVFHQKERPQVQQELNEILKTVLQFLPLNWRVVFKCHPRLPLGQQKALKNQKELRSIIFLTSQEPLYHLIVLSDALMHFGSSALVPALASNRPIFSYCLKNHPGFQETCRPYQSDIKIFNLKELGQTIKALPNHFLYDRKKELLRLADRQQAGIFDGQNSQRLLKLILT